MFVPPAIPTAVHAASIGIPDTMLLMLLALVVFGPRRLPEIGRQIGKLMYEFRKISNDFKFQMEEELRVSEEMERQRLLSAATAETPHTPPPAPDFTAANFPPQDFPEPFPSALPADAIAPAAADVSAASDPSAASQSVLSPAASAEAAAPSFPSIQPPRQGGVVPRAFRGLVPQPTASADPALSETAAPVAPAPEASQATEQPGQTAEQPQKAEEHG